MCASRRGRRAAATLASLLPSLLAAGCVEVSLREARPLDYAPVPQPERPPPTEGAIWRGGSSSGSFLFFDQKARSVGDLVTVLIVEETRARGAARTETQRDSQIENTLTSDAGLQALAGVPVSKALQILGMGSGGSGGTAGSEFTFLDSESRHDFQGEGETERSGSFSGVITCRVVDVLPGGVFHIRGQRQVVINHEEQNIGLEGLVRREDLGINNTVTSSSLAELRLTYDGLGVVDDTQRPGWLARVFHWVYPF